jgi:hypothetical protein
MMPPTGLRILPFLNCSTESPDVASHDAGAAGDGTHPGAAGLALVPAHHSTGNTMAQLSQKLAEMHRRLAETTQEEQALIRALNAALNHVDEKLLSEIRQVTVQHEQRRALIMNELQLLASRLCAIPLQGAEPLTAIEHALPPAHQNGVAHHPARHNGGHDNGAHNNGGHDNAAYHNGAHLAEVARTHAPGNWRMAAQNIQDDLDFYTDPPASSH